MKRALTHLFIGSMLTVVLSSLSMGGDAKKDVSDPVLNEVITLFDRKMPRFIDKHGENVFVADEPINRGSLLSAMYEYDRSLRPILKQEIEDAYYRWALKATINAAKLNNNEYSHFVTTSTEQDISGTKTFSGRVAFTGSLSIANTDATISSRSGSGGIEFPDGSRLATAYPKVVFVCKTTTNEFPNENTKYPLVSGSIVPTSSKNRIRITVCASVKSVTDGATVYSFTIARNATDLAAFSEFTANRYERHTATFVYVDAPGATNEVTYVLKGSVSSSSGASVEFKSITLEEIGFN